MSRPVSYYLDLITSQYRQSTKFLAWLTAALEVLDDTTSTIVDIVNAFDLDNAVGVQLDVVGGLVGQGRTVNFIPSGGISLTLADANYRTLLKAKIVKNHWTGQVAELVTAWELLFPGTLIIINDNQDMTMLVTLAGDFSSLVQELVTNGYIVPKPEGVHINFAWGHLPVFGYDQQSDYLDGYDVGWWANYT